MEGHWRDIVRIIILVEQLVRRLVIYMVRHHEAMILEMWWQRLRLSLWLLLLRLGNLLLLLLDRFFFISLTFNHVVRQSVSGQMMGLRFGYMLLHVIVARMLIDKVVPWHQMAQVGPLVLIVGEVEAWNGVTNHFRALTVVQAVTSGM